MNHKLAIVVPYRNREEHLKEFVPYMNKFLSSNIECPFSIVVIEQANQEKFNRGTLINIGFDLVKDDCTYISPHDVDLLPETSDYSVPQNPTHLSAYRSQNNYMLEYEGCFGGVNLFLNEHFKLVNGFSNIYCGYGAEDDDLRRRCSLCNLQIDRRFGRYTSLPHTYDHVDPKDIEKNRNYYYGLLHSGIHAAYNSGKNNGLNSLNYNVISKKEIDYIHYFVDFKNEQQS
jgi:hypothetical protein